MKVVCKNEDFLREIRSKQKKAKVKNTEDFGLMIPLLVLQPFTSGWSKSIILLEDPATFSFRRDDPRSM